MKKTTYQNKGLAILLFLLSLQTFAQNYVPFSPRFDQDVKGDIVLIGNNILGPSNNAFNDNSAFNNRVNMQYIDIDGDPSTFSSSSADLAIPNPDCYRIVRADLYWAAVNPGSEPITDVKLKGPTGGYNDITGTVIYDAGTISVDGGNSFSYACHADVTDIVTAFGSVSDLGTYTVANVSSAVGRSQNVGNGTGQSAGWSLFIVYEDPTLPGKSITSFDGFSAISAAQNPFADISISGFRTVPAPAPVRANFAFATLEGDKSITGDRLRLNGSSLSTVDRPSNNFFNSSVTQLSALPVNNRNPNSTNTLGFDTGILSVPNPSNSVIANESTSAVVRLETGGDTYFPYFFAMAVEIIEPKIVLTKIVEDNTGANIGGQIVELGDQLNYVIGFQNTGNDDATELFIRDILPTNVVFDYPSDLASLPPGVTVESYNEATRELLFRVDPSAVEENDPVQEIRFAVTVVATCSLLSDACSNLVDNQAFATYKGTLNPNFTISDDPSFSENTGCLLNPAVTNFLADINDCVFEEEVILCGATTELVASDGYNNYTWSSSESLTPVIGNTQSITVSETGTYYVYNEAVAPCQSITQVFRVVNFGTTVTNPVIPFADEVVICPNDGKELPNIFLCGANDLTSIQTGISDTSSMIWEKLNEASCDAVTNQDCANESNSCTWNQVQTGPNFDADTAGQYRLTLNYAGGCFSQYYFNVYENILDPNVSSRDIYCNTDGEIVVGGVPSGYEYSLDGTNYQDSNVFTVTTADIYTVYIRQVGVSPNPCIFTVPDVQIRERDFTTSVIIEQPLCNGEKGNVVLAANDVRAQYNFSIYSGVTIINGVGPINDSSYEFENLNPGFYTVNISTEDGCVHSEIIEIINPELLTATSALTSPLTCSDGEITIYPEGGTAPYFYFINGSTDFETVPTIDFTAAGVFDIRVVDSNNCVATTSITVEDNPAPIFTVNHNDILCYNDNTGEIEFDVTNANGYALEYSIDNGVTYVANPVFSNLSAGDYEAIVKYSLDGSECFSTPESITISQPDNALTASSGVSELAGCGPSGEGKVRITNPQGGTAPYEYSFDNQGSWITSNEAFVTPGTYTLYIKDANDCIYAMPEITLDPEPVEPTIDISDPEFNCDGTADATVTVTNSEVDMFTYNYLLDGVANTNTADPTVFLDVPNGSHTITVDYQLRSVATYSNLLYENFGYGEDTSSPGINPTYYCFERQVVGSECKGQIFIQDGDYTVTSRIVRPYNSWLQPGDHTPATTPATADGRYLAVNIGSSIPATEILYEKFIDNIIPNQPINVEFYAINLLRSGTFGANPDLAVALIDASGNEISSYSTGEIPKSNQWEEYPKTPITLDPGANTSLRFILRSNVQQNNGNDVAVDDITVYQLPRSCVTEVEFPFVVDSGRAFSASITGSEDVSCNGATDGSISIAAQNFDSTTGFEYSTDNGTTWTTQMTSPYTITGLAADTYDVLIRFETCSFPFSQTISEPGLFEVTASGTPITCITGSTVTASATGGTAAYAYELLDTATLNLISTFPSNGILTNISAGDYTVRATDANDCTATTTLTLSGVTAPTATLSTSSNFCYNPTSGGALVVDAAGGQTPYEYSITSGVYQDSNAFNDLAPGNYTITVRDANGCTVVLPAETIAPQVAVAVELTKELDCTTSPEASISGTISQGYAPYTVTLLQGTGTVSLTGNTFSLSTATAGNYQFEVTDSEGCVVASNVINVNAISTPTVSASQVNVTCNGNSDGSVQLTGSGGSGGYTYSDDNVTFSATNTFTGLAAGTYSFYVKDSKDCTNTVSVTITEPTTLTATANATEFSCSATNTKEDATITITVPTTGTSPYQYSFNGGTTFTSNNSLTVNDNGTTQTFSYVVKDANGCLTAAQNISIEPLNPPTDLSVSVTDITCLVTEATATITATNGVGVLQYETISPSPIIVAQQTSNVFNNLTSGTYVFRVTDANGCYYTESYTIDPVTNITVTGLKLSDVLCSGDTTGSVQFSVAEFASTYAYTINGGTAFTAQTNATITLTALPAGNQTIVVTDETTGCTATETINITEPATPLSLSAVATNVHCNNYNSQITVTANNGTPSYTYAAVLTGAIPTAADYNSGNVITVNTSTAANLIWDVYVKDANGCTEFTTVTIIAETGPTVTAPAVSNQCTAASGFMFTVSGTGIAPLSYSINGGSSFQTSPTFTVNTPGNYTITIKDGNGCIATSATTTDVYAPLSASVLLTEDLTCSLPVEASIDISVSGGNATYTYEVSDDGGVSYSTISGSPYTTTTAGTYQFRITDANNCDIVTNSVTVTPATDPVILGVNQTQDIACASEETAAIDISIDPSVGLAPFEINVTNTTTGTDYGTQTSGLAAGDYIITVTDAKGCTDTEAINIVQPDPIILDFDVDPITCASGGVSLGQIIINSVSGGTTNYSYHVTGVNGYDVEIANQPGTSQIFEVVDFGLYEIIITDANGCSVMEQNILVASPPDNLDIDINTTADCLTGGTAEVSIGSLLTGNGPYHFAIYEGSGMVYTSPTNAPWQDEDAVGSEKTTFTGLIPGATYTFIVFDELTGCYYYETSDTAVPTSSSLTTTSIVPNNITCTGSADGTVSFDINSVYGIDTIVNYEIYNSQSVTTTGVSGTGTVPANGTLTVTDLGLLDFGNYIIVIEETVGVNAGCSVVTDSFNITESAIELSITASSTKNETCNELGIISAIAKDGTSPYEYQTVLTGGSVDDTAWGTSNTFKLAAGVYDVYVRDAYGCVKFEQETIIKDPEPTLNTVAPQCFDGTAINITLVEGTSTAITPLTYSIGGAYQSSPNFSITTAGTYTLSVQDGNGCIATSTYVVNAPILLDANLSKEIDCTVTPGATINLTPSGGTGTYTYEVDYNSGGYVAIAGSPYTAATSGAYQFRVTDTQNCIAESGVIVVEDAIIPTLTTVETNVTCNLGADGSITVTATAGVAPFEYSIDGGAFQASNVFSNLSQGSYDIVVRDSKNCESLPVSVAITEPTIVTGSGVLTQELTCGAGNATQQAIVTVTGSGGTSPYTYSFDGGANYTSTNTFNTYNSGTVSAFVKDANGCISATSIDVVVPPTDAPTDLDFAATAITCDVTTSEVTLTVTNGIAPFTFEIISPTASVASNGTGVFPGLAVGDYVFTVTDASGCYYTESYTINPVINITVSGLLVDDVSCTSGNDGAVDFTVANFASTYSYTINGGTAVTGQTSSTINLTGLSVGNQTIIVTDEATNCTSTATINVSEPALLTLVEATNINANCNVGAQVSVTATNGTAPYQYAFVEDGVVPSTGDYTNSASATLDPATNTNWDVWVMDSNGCTDSIDVVITTDALPTVDVPTFASNQCNLTGDVYSFTVTNPTGVVPFEYSIGEGFQAGTTFSVNNPGTYFVTIKDGNGCTFTNATPITVYDVIDVTSTIEALPSCNVNDGEITVSGTGGSGSYAFSINPSAGITQTGNTFSGLAALTNYIVTITDTVTNCTNTVDVNLDQATPVSFTATAIGVTCLGDSDGVITVDLDASNDNPLYTYAIIAGPITVTAQSSNVFTGLPTGNYTVEVTSGRGCTETEIVSVGTPTAIVVPTPTVEEFACVANTNTSNYATITVAGVSGGSGNFITYEFIRDADGVVVQSNSSNVYTVTNTLGGTFTINVYDDKGCLGSTSASVNPFISLDDLTITIDNAITCTNDEDVTISVTTSGGTPTNLQFTLEDVVGSVNGGVYSQVNTTGNFTGLSIGNYLATVVNLDTGCMVQDVHYVSNPDTFDLTVDNVVNVTCFSANDGSVDVTFIDRTPTPVDNAGAFNYEVFDYLGNSVTTGTATNAGPVNISGLLSGTYSITATLSNAPFCTVNKNFTITAPTAALAISETHTAITCVTGNNDGSISASATGGWPGAYEYQLSNTGGTVVVPFGAESNFTGLVAGNYTVTVKDSSGCEDSIDVLLVNPTPINLTASADITLLNCFGDSNSTITVTTTVGGQGSNYTYTLNMVSPTVTSSGPQTGISFSGLGAGTYNVTVTDGYSCSETSADIIITAPAEVEAVLAKSTSPTCIDSAALTLSASGGTGAYEYSETSNFATVLGTFVSSVTFDAAPGVYAYFVRDANGCTANVSNEITVDALLPLEVDLDTTNATINCTGDTTGVIIATASGGLGNYIYTLQDGSGTDITPAPTQNSPGVFTGLTEGNYLVEVESGDCLETSIPVAITGPTNPLTVSYVVSDVTCPASDDGVLNITATGGTGIIKYAISPLLLKFEPDPIFDNLAPGIYQAVVQDELGCFVIIDFEVEDATPLVLSLVPNSTFPEVCDGDMDGEFSVDLVGGEMPYSVVLDDLTAGYTLGGATQTQFDFTNLSGGDHIVYVRDNLGCETEWNISFPEAVLINPEAEVEYGCSNNTSTNTVTVSVDESITDLTDLDYSLNGGAYQASNIFTNVPAGLGHYIDVRHTNGCIKRTELFDINAIQPLLLGIEAGGLNEIVATATGGEAPYEFTLNGESFGSTSSFIYYESGDYTVTVTDRNGCIATATLYFEFVDVCITNYFTPNGDGVLDEWGPGCTSIYNDLTFDIFDRYGRVVAKLKAGQKWNGEYHGKELPSGDYWYVVKLNDSRNNREFVGHFTLYR